MLALTFPASNLSATILHGGKTIDRGRSIGIAGLQDRRRERGFVRRIREVLRFHAKRRAPGVDSAFSLERPIEKVARVELQAWLCREDFHDAPGLGIGNLCSSLFTDRKSVV